MFWLFKWKAGEILTREVREREKIPALWRRAGIQA
jgi:hypothetical protein